MTILPTRADRNNNPTAFTSDIAAQAGLRLDVDYKIGDQFQVLDRTYYTALLIGDPIPLTIKVIDKIGYTTQHGIARWNYINLPKFVWDSLSNELKRDVIGFHYKNEGGSLMMHLFPNYGKI